MRAIFRFLFRVFPSLEHSASDAASDLFYERLDARDSSLVSDPVVMLDGDEPESDRAP